MVPIYWQNIFLALTSAIGTNILQNNENYIHSDYNFVFHLFEKTRR